MDLKPFYDLQDRLHAGAIAGAALVAEDFRLTRALEAMAPLEKAAPVFAKLGQLTRALLAPDCPDRAGALLDALSLADAIACTQGAAAMPGEVEPLPLVRYGRAFTNAPYSVVAPLLEALTTSGGGKYSFVIDTHKERPELFQDYRVKAALVKALGASYGELARQAEEWLSQEDESILPLLQNGFDPKGKKEMARRMSIIETIAGAKANGFYREQIPLAEKDVRIALIYALRHDEGNAEKLVELCKTEKGKSKDAAHFALAQLDVPAAWDYWDAFRVKKPDKAAEYMQLSPTGKAAEITALAWDRWLISFEKEPTAPLEWSEKETLQTLAYALFGKSGTAVCAIYRRMAALGTALDNKNVEHAPGNRPISLVLSTSQLKYLSGSWPFSQFVPELLRLSMLYYPAPDLLALAEELETQYPGRFTAAVITAALLDKPAGEVWALIQPILEPSFDWNKKRRGKNQKALCTALECVYWDEKEQRPALCVHFTEAFSMESRGMQTVWQPLREPLDRRIYDGLIRQMGTYDELVISLIPTVRDKALRRQIGETLYRQAQDWSKKEVAVIRQHLDAMKTCGWTVCEGLGVLFCKNQKVNFWRLQTFIEDLPGDDAARLKEAQTVYELATAGKIASLSASQRNTPYYLNRLKNYIDTLQSHISSDSV